MEKNVRNKVVAVRLTTDEYDLVEGLAQAFTKSSSEIMREALRLQYGWDNGNN